jgi:hypothetical protein
MGGAKKVDAKKYLTKPNSSRDLAIMLAMQQAQTQQQATQAQLLDAYAKMAPAQQEYDAAAESKRLAELGMANVQRSREMEQMVSPEAAQMRQAQGAELARLASMDNAAQYMNEWARNQGLIQGYETGLGDSTIGQAATYDAALKAKANYDQQNLALQQETLRQMQAPVGGIDPSTSISAQEANKASNLQALQNWQNAMYGNIGGFNQSVSDQMAQAGANFQNLQQNAMQNKLNYQGALLGQQAQNLAADRAMTGAYAQAAGNIVSGAAQGYGSMAKGAGAASKGIAGYGGQQYVPKTSSTGGQFYAPISGTI